VGFAGVRGGEPLVLRSVGGFHVSQVVIVTASQLSQRRDLGWVFAFW
jgi:hypothetical protein